MVGLKGLLNKRIITDHVVSIIARCITLKTGWTILY